MKIYKILNRNKEEKVIDNSLTDEEIISNCSYHDNIFFTCSECNEIGNREKYKFEKEGNVFLCKKCRLSSLDRTKYKNKKRTSEFYSNMSNKRTKESFEKAKITREETNLKRYGVKNLMLLDETKEKIKETNLKRYGVKNPMQSDEIKEKSKMTNLKRYGGTTPFFSKKIRDKAKQTNLERYGAEHALQNEVIKKKGIRTCLENYGVENIFQYSETRKKLNKKIFCNNIESIKKVGFTPLFDIDDYIGKKNNINYRWRCNKCQTEFDDKFYSKKNFPRCPKCNPFIKGYSLGEIELLNFIEGAIKYRDRFEIDAYLEDKKIGFEYNGLYWHSDIFKANDYHLNKTKYFQEKGIRVYHIFEDEWNNKKNIVKSIINTKLNIYTETVFARKCIIKEVSKTEAREFQDENHIQGKAASLYNLGLYYNNELVSLMTFGKSRFDKKIDWELVRFVNKKNTKITGGASKLFKNFLKNHNGSSIISYSDERLFDGGLYKVLGFQYSHTTKPNFYYVNNGNRYNRMMFQKHKLEGKISNFNKLLTERENMKINNFNRIYDCGQKVWIY